MDRPGAVHRDAAHLRQSRRWDLHPFGGSGHPRRAIAAKVNITYKLLFNDAVAMTGGQPGDTGLTVPVLTRQLAAEGVGRIVVVTDEPDKYPQNAGFPPASRSATATILTRCSASCARSRASPRSSTIRLAPPKSAAAASAAGSPIRQSASLSTSWFAKAAATARKPRTAFRSCRSKPSSGANARSTSRAATKTTPALNGFCPSFVTVHGGGLKKRRAGDLGEEGLPPLPEPAQPALDRLYGILVTGVGGTGVVTIGALLGMAAHLEGKGCTVLDMTGLAQKGGAVYSHIRIAEKPDQIHAVRIAAGNAELLLGCDLVVSASADALTKLEPGYSRAVVNRHETITGDFTRNPDLVFPTDAMERSIAEATDPKMPSFSTRLGLRRGSSAIRLPAICLCSAMLINAVSFRCHPTQSSARSSSNAVAVDFNRDAFRWGRRAALER